MTTIFTTKTLFNFGSPIITLEEQGDSLSFALGDGQSASFSIEETGLLIEALTELHGIMVRRNKDASEGNGEEGNGEENKENKDLPIPDGIILPPFNFDTLEKLCALVGRAVRLRNGSDRAVESVDLAYDGFAGAKEAILLEGCLWLYQNGAYYEDGSQSEFDMVAVLAK
jgi:hypothetical protein